ncbi:hypothetical protein O3P69_012391 [Scylla paramamosain]|uniref:Uncharacterized protein n=1 Tax=Scylla paramamosain TaxID=85552 RepID=A0AAW0SF58_SCYPA
MCFPARLLAGGLRCSAANLRGFSIAASTRPEPTVGVTNGSLDAVCHRIAGERQADHESGRCQLCPHLTYVMLLCVHCFWQTQCLASPQRGQVPSRGAILSNQPQHVKAASPGSLQRLFVFSPFLSTVAARWPFFTLTPARD